MLLAATGLFLAAVAFMVAEVFLPSMGLLGAACVAALAGSVWCAFRSGPVAGWGFTAAAVVGMPSLLVALLRVLPRTRLGRRYLLHGPEGPLEGTASGAGRHLGLVGREGRTATDLRPAGIAVFGRERVDVVSEGLPVGKGQDVVVDRVEGNRVVVRPVRRAEGGAGPG